MFINDLKLKIKEILDKRSMSIYELANQAQVSEACIRNWYSRRNYEPSLDSLIKIASVLNISLSQLFLDKKESNFPVNPELRRFLDNFLALDAESKKLITELVIKLTRGKLYKDGN